MPNSSDNTVYKKIAIPLKGFKRMHSPLGGGEPKTCAEKQYADSMFVGRKKIFLKLRGMMESTSTKRGSYLIAGYRGSGKTSLVNMVIDDYEADKTPYNRTVFRIMLNLGNESNLTPIRLFYSISIILLEEFQKKNRQLRQDKEAIEKRVKYYIWPLITLIFLVAILPVIQPVINNVTDFFWLTPFIETLHKIAFPLVISILCVPLFEIFRFFFRNHKSLKIIKSLKDLIEKVGFETTDGVTLGNVKGGLSLNKSKKSLPVHAREAEEFLVKIVQEISSLGDKKEAPFEVVFVLDEIDKLSKFDDVSELDRRKNSAGESKISNINQLLGSIKYFITTCHAKFFVISGRETLDSYYSEKGSANSLYESLFNGVFEVPSLLTDPHKGYATTQISSLIELYLCKAIGWNKGCSELGGDFLEQNLKKYFKYLNGLNKTGSAPEQQRYLVSVLRSLVNYLTFHSWGNPKRLAALFESFVVPGSIICLEKDTIESFGYDIDDCKKNDWLSIDINDLRCISLSSEIFTLFQHHLSREVSKTSDKLTVSALSSLHFILKMHPYAFTRESFHRMSEAINIYRSPELNTIVEDLLSNILKSYMRRIRNGAYRYRFIFGFEQELRYISHVNELESASYNFSLNSMGPVKESLEISLRSNDDLDDISKAKLYTTLGDMCAIEQSYNSAAINYGIAYASLKRLVLEKTCACDLDNAMLFCEIAIKYGDLEERKKNYNQASAIYISASCFVQCEIGKNPILKKMLLEGDSKWDMFKQPYWAANFLSLKRSASSSPHIDIANLYSEKDERKPYKLAVFSFFNGDIKLADFYYKKAIKMIGDANNDNEKKVHLKGHAMVGLAETRLLLMAKEMRGFYNSGKGDKEYKREFSKKLKRFINGQVFGLNGTLFISGETPMSNEEIILRNKSYYGDKDFSHLLLKSADLFFHVGLYVSAVISYLKFISYWSCILDFFTRSEIQGDNFENEIKFIFNFINKVARRCVECMAHARGLDSSQFSKTFIVKDQPEKFDNDILIGLFDSLILNKGKDSSLSEPFIWQQSLWTHKLASTLCWSNLVKSKLLENRQSTMATYPNEMSTLSVRPAILIRWIYARDLLNELMHKEWVAVIASSGRGVDPITYLRDIYFKNPHGNSLSYGVGKAYLNDTYLDQVFLSAYKIARNLYFSLQNIQLISRKNTDLLFPYLCQVYYCQWKLLAMLISICFIKDVKKGGQSAVKSLRSYALEVQRVLMNLDRELALHEAIPPTHFDYEHIFLRAKLNLLDASNINEPSTRVCSSVLQQKHYCHDDHSDPEFRMDWTLAHMFSPSSKYLLDDIEDVHELFSKQI